MDDELYLILGCFGRTDTIENNSFISCPGIENKILMLADHLQHQNDIIEYLDSVRLFDRPLFDGNGIKNVIFHMQKKYFQHMKPLWKESAFSLYERFLHNHKLCGNYLKLALIAPGEDINKDVEFNDSILIPAQKTVDTIISNNRRLKLVTRPK